MRKEKILTTYRRFYIKVKNCLLIVLVIEHFFVYAFSLFAYWKFVGVTRWNPNFTT